MPRPYDLYETHPRFVNDLLHFIKDQLPVKYSNKYDIAEICAGKNAITTVLKEKGYSVYTNDIQPNSHNGQYDATYPTLYRELKKLNIEWIISNIPFSPSISLAICELAVKAGFKCAFILPLNFLEPSMDRENFLTNYPRSGEIVLPRYSFTGDGKTNQFGVAWQLWNTQHIGNHTASRL